jgi:sugar-specific transcriptional regulator TrmB
LTELGLSNVQAKIYLTLAKSRTLKASEISSLSGVARPDVYRVLIQLEEAGLVEVMMCKPEEFHAISIEKCVSILIQRRILKTAELQQKVLTLTHDFKRDAAKEEPEEKYQFMLISNKDAVYAKAEKMTRSAQERICFLALKKRIIVWLFNSIPLLEETLARKVSCQIVLPKNEKDQGFDELTETLGKYSNFSLRLLSESPDIGFSVWDRKEVLMNNLSIDSLSPHPTLWSNNKSIVELSQNYFDLMWQKAQKANLCE